MRGMWYGIAVRGCSEGDVVWGCSIDPTTTGHGEESTL